MRPKPRIGQGILEVSEALDLPVPALEPMDWDRRIAASTLIKLVTDVAPPHPSEITERDLRVMSPAQIESGLYVPNGKRDQQVVNAYRGVIFPSEQFLLIARSPADLALHIGSKTLRDRAMRDDREASDKAGKRASGHVLEKHLKGLTDLLSYLETEESNLLIFSNELHGANNSGYYSHYKAKNLQPIKTSVEGSIFGVLEVAATTHGWNKDKIDRARKTVRYQLYGPERRVKTWIGYTDMALKYATAKSTIIKLSKNRTEAEFEKYKPYLDEARETT